MIKAAMFKLQDRLSELVLLNPDWLTREFWDEATQRVGFAYLGERERKAAEDVGARAERLREQLAALVAEHAWLSGPEWHKATQEVGEGYFEDAPELVNAAEFCEGVLRGLQEGLAQ